MSEPITSAIGSVLSTGLAVRCPAFIAKKTDQAIRELFSEDEAKRVLEKAFMELKESAVIEAKDTKDEKDEKILLHAFEEFFTDERTIKKLQSVFAGQGERGDFNLLGGFRTYHQA